MKQNEIILDVEHLNTYFRTHDGRVKAVDDLSFSVKKGELLGIVGESGCGKSVTMLSIMGLVDRSAMVEAEKIDFQGQDLSKMSKEEIRKLRGSEMSMIFQEPLTSLNPLFTIGNQLYEMVKIHSKESPAKIKERCIEMLRLVGIPRPEEVYKNYPNTLSGGMRQRVMIAMALSCNPKLLVADEPTTALDVTIQAQILDLLREVRARINGSIMLITHDLGVVAEMADYVVVMYAGRIIEKGTVQEIFLDPKHPYTIGLMKSKPVVGKTEERLYSIPGQVPNPINLPNYCYFRDRCEMRVHECAGEYPCLRRYSDTHYVACRLENVRKAGD